LKETARNVNVCGMSMAQIIAFLYVALIVWVMWALKMMGGGTQNGLERKWVEASINQGLEPIQKSGQNKQKRGRRVPQPRTPEDCPHCCAEAETNAYPEGAQCVVPYAQLRYVVYKLQSLRRDRPKTN
jgi:hypothetical protein